MTTLMEQEARQAPACIATQLAHNVALWQKVVACLQAKPPKFVMTIARGSSDHAALFAKYLFEVCLGIPTVSFAPSVASIYQKSLQVQDALVIGISQSGKSPDICAAMAQAKQGGALTVALVNVIDSPLAAISDFVIPITAGPENAVAATKSYLGTLSALVQGIALWQNDPVLLKALTCLPQGLEETLTCDWSPLLQAYQEVSSTLIIGRGFGFGIAQEAALKCKETSGIHAEAFSSAEVLHGPFALVKADFPVLVFGQNDASLPSTLHLIERLAALQAKVFLALPLEPATKSAVCHPREGGNPVKGLLYLDSRLRGNDTNNVIDPSLKQLLSLPKSVVQLPLPQSLHPILDPLLVIQRFYLFAAQLAVARGLNPDQPQNLKKVTETK